MTGKILNDKEINKLLNELNDSNEQLKQENEQLKKENEELKFKNKKLHCIMNQLEVKYEDKGFSLAYDMEECE